MHMGAEARACLMPGLRGAVLAALSGTVYLHTASGALLWLASEDAPMHRRCLKVAAPFPRPAPAAHFHVDDHRLAIEPGLVFDWTTARTWHPPRLNCADVVGMDGIPARVRALAASLDLSRAQGFGRFISDILGVEPASAIDVDCPVLAHARPVVLRVADACRCHDMARIALGADALIGLGSGLTPSGDDFVGGLLFGIKTLGAAYPCSGLPDTSFITETHRARTHPVSFVLLSDLANGHAIEPLHHIVNGILGGDPPESIHVAVSQLTQVGHSTGWDVLTGLFVGLLVADCASSACSTKGLP